MLFTQPDTSVFYKVRDDPAVSVNERRFKQLAVEEAEAVWSDYGLADIQSRVEEFEDAYGVMDASGTYQVNNENGSVRVLAHPVNQYPLDPALDDPDEPGSVPGEFDDLNERLIDAQKEVASRLTDRLDEFVTRAN